jgi:hypothetical protein
VYESRQQAAEENIWTERGLLHNEVLRNLHFRPNIIRILIWKPSDSECYTLYILSLK